MAAPEIRPLSAERQLAADHDRALMARVAGQDRAAYAELLNRHLRGATVTAYRILLNMAGAEE
ncbi:MAG: hypothetical protein KBB36_15645, partial [Ferrovibrio sp.]|nr:hypothetical protein [Ferrovibrio sp.]